MKLLFAIKALSPLGGGAERVFADIVNGLHQRGHEITVLTFESLDMPGFYEVEKDIPRWDIGAPGVPNKAALLRYLPGQRKRILDLAPDIVVAFMPSCYVPLGAILAGSGLPVIASEHSVPKRYVRKPLRWATLVASALYVTKFTGVSEQMRAQFPDLVSRKMAVLPNPVVVPENSRADPVGPVDGPKRVIAVGRLHEEKDHLTLIRAFARLSPRFPDWRLEICGEGEERTKLEAEIAALGMSTTITLRGAVRDIHEAYRSAQLYVIPSRYESYGLATVEALAHGLPAVGFADCPGTNQLIDNGVNGVLARPGQNRISALESALASLLLDPALRAQLGNAALSSTNIGQQGNIILRWLTFLQETITR